MRAAALALSLLALAGAHAALGGDAEVDAIDGPVDGLIEAGAGGLALRIIDRDQPPLASSAVLWQRFERRRLDVLVSRDDWAAVIARVAEYPASVPDDFRAYAEELSARAHLARGDGKAAAAVLAGLIWGSAQATAMVDERRARLERWRALLAESYLLADRLDDAQTTVLRYGLDYGDPPAGWRLVYARALIRNGDHARARELLEGLESTEVEYLRLLMRAREPGVDPVDLLIEMGPMLGEGRLLPAERAQLWAALAGAAARYRDDVVRVTAMEQAVALAASVEARDRIVAIDVDDLWGAYEAHAATLANEARLLVGRFDAWLALAREYDGAGDVRARALYAYLAEQKRDARVAGAARAHLAEALAAQPHGLDVLGALYLGSDRYADIGDVPAELRAPLVAYALYAGRGDLGERLLEGLDAQARGALALRWRTPVAVALIGAGRVDEGLALFAVDAVAASGASETDTAAGRDAPDEQLDDKLADELADSLARVALALQNAGEYAHASAFAARALNRTRDPRRRRALLLLGADSEALAGHHARAASLYIGAARVPVADGADGRARAATLEAARALARAGLDADAVAVLERLPADGPDTGANDVTGRLLRRY